MTAPNIVNITSMLGKTDTTSLTTTSATSVLENAVGSNKVLRVTLVRAVNIDGSNAADVTIAYYTQDNLGGTAMELVQAKNVNANTFFDVVTKDTPIYLEEDKSLGATASAANDLKIIVTYEEIT